MHPDPYGCGPGPHDISIYPHDIEDPRETDRALAAWERADRKRAGERFDAGEFAGEVREELAAAASAAGETRPLQDHALRWLPEQLLQLAQASFAARRRGGGRGLHVLVAAGRPTAGGQAAVVLLPATLNGGATMGEQDDTPYEQDYGEQAASAAEEAAERDWFATHGIGDFLSDGPDEDPGEFDRAIAAGEVSIAKFAGGDPVKALGIASSMAEERRYLLRQLGNAEAMVEARIEELQAWLAGRREEVERRVGRLDRFLEQYQLDFHEADRTKAGNINTELPYGATLERKQTKWSREWTDEDAALGWQQAQQMMIDALWEEIILPQGGIEFLVRLVAKKTEAMADAP